MEYLAVAGERVHPLLNARAAGVVDHYQRIARFQCGVHALLNLASGCLADRAAADREVLRCNIHRATVNYPVTGYHAFAREVLVGHPEVGAAVLHEQERLAERIFLEQLCDSLPGGQLAGIVLLFDSFRSAALNQFCAMLTQRVYLRA